MTHVRSKQTRVQQRFQWFWGGSIGIGSLDQFDVGANMLCLQPAIEHRLIPPRHSQTNGMVECFNGRISEVANQTRFASRAELESTLRNYPKIYNHNIPQRALDSATPIQAMKQWQAKKSELFAKSVYNQVNLDKYLFQVTKFARPHHCLTASLREE